jgi:hypothetical protein
MSDRYFGKVVATTDKYTIVVNRGAEHGVKAGDRFLIVGLGPTITDPDTQEELERLEIVRGKVAISHVQERISTARSCEFEKSSDVKEIKKVTSRGGGVLGLMAPQDTVTESITPGEESLKALNGAQVGDLLLKLSTTKGVSII